MSRRTNKNPDTTGSTSGKTSSTARRRILQGLAVGGAFITARTLPEQWTRPIVQAVGLPAHAQTSPGDIMTGETMLVVDGPEMESFQLRLRRSISDAGGDPGILDKARFASARARRGSLLDYVVSPAEATEGMMVIIRAALEASGACTVSFLFSGEFPCDPVPVEFELNICVQGQFANRQLGATANLNSNCDTPTPVEILAIDDDSARLGISFIENVQIDLDPGGSVPPCPSCEDELEDLGILIEACGIPKPGP